MVTMIAAGEPVGTLGGSALASWAPFWTMVAVLGGISVVLFVVGRPSTPSWPLLQPLSRIPNGLTRITRIPGWAAVAIGMALYGLLIAGQGFYADVSWHIALGRDDDLFTAPHAGILLGLVLIVGGAVLGTVIATFERVDGIEVGALRVPPSLVPLWALGLGAVAGFPLDELWHRAYGVDVTMWSPTHMLMILGATFTGMAAWLILAGSGVRPTDGPWGRGAHVVCGWLTLQGLLAPMGEFTFGVPQFSLLFAPILVSMAAGLGLLAFRLVHGAWWTLGLVAVNLALQVTSAFGGDESPVTERFGATFLASAVVVEVAARLLGTTHRTRLALVTGVGIGTIGLAAEWAWNQDARQAWTSALLPEAVLLATIAAVGAAVLGVTFSRAIDGDRGARPVAPIGVVLAAVACLAVIVLPMRRPTGDVTADIRLEPALSTTVFVTATLSPPDAADDAYWFQTSAWQGGGLELADMRPTGETGEYRSESPVPVDGLWKSLLRLHRGAEMMAIPIYLPADPEIGEPEIPAVDKVAPFESERDYLLRETHDGNAWLSPLVHLLLIAVCASWAAAFTYAVRQGAGDRDGGARKPAPRSAAAAEASAGVTGGAAAGPAAPPSPA